MFLKVDVPVETIVSELEGAIPEAMKRERVPGLSIALIRDAECVWAKGFGVKNTETGEAVTAETVFAGCSLSKPLAAYAALKMCELGHLELDRSLSAYLPHPFVPDEPRLAEITLRRVVSHSSGLPHGSAPWKIGFSPGEKFAYSWVGYAYMQEVMERISGMPFAEYMEENLLVPFGMQASSFIWKEAYETQATQSHDEDGAPQEDYKPSEGGAANSLYTTASDFARVLVEIVQPGETDAFRLSEAGVAQMLTPQIRISDDLSWGLGWGSQHSEEGDSFWQWGWYEGFRNFTVAFQDQKIGVVILTNGAHGHRIWNDIVLKSIGGTHPVLPWKGMPG